MTSETDPPEPAPVAPGWYPAPDMPGTLRYWDGREWTGHVAPTTTPSRGPSATTIARGVALGVAAVVAGLFFLVQCEKERERTEYIDCITGDEPSRCVDPDGP